MIPPNIVLLLFPVLYPRLSASPPCSTAAAVPVPMGGDRSDA
ncbi:hypothetical protein [Belnapia arida]|nr:hypothetical protein [Belnapia arida]